MQVGCARLVGVEGLGDGLGALVINVVEREVDLGERRVDLRGERAQRQVGKTTRGGWSLREGRFV